MKRPRSTRIGLALGAGVLATMALSPIAAFATSAHKTKALSQPNITLGLVAGSDDVASYYTAIDKGFYKKLGLNITVTDATGGTSANNVAALVGNSWQFGVISPQSMIALEAQDPQLRSLMATEQGGNDELTINQNVAAADHIPSSGSTPAGAIAQLNALKGSHLKIAYSTLTSTSLDDMLAVFQKYGITYSLNNSQTTDVDLNAVGSSGVLQTAVVSGKDDALINNPPVSVLANTIVISIRQLYPANHISSFDLTTTTSEIQQHPDVVQAMVTGTVEGMMYSAAHPTQAIKFMTQPLASTASAQVTSPEGVDYIVGVDLQDRACSPLISKANFLADLVTANAAAATPYVVTYNNFIDNKFITKAIKTTGFKSKCK